MRALACRRPVEREVQRRVVALYRAMGCIVFSLSQGYRPGGKRHGTTRQSKGLPDLYVMGSLIRLRRAWWHETKRPRGKQSPEQRNFQVLCEARGIGYVLGGTVEAMDFLVAHGIARRAEER